MVLSSAGVKCDDSACKVMVVWASLICLCLIGSLVGSNDESPDVGKISECNLTEMFVV